ncbi:uncharacterized protein FMAN_15531 [Fusarium mangiferae]|uniref:Uncharacterized protein n=1 Tax=Fusarium mangiferae TaxID=192010 RepID=A0A1L7UNL7_FUSMA|nr:uncharacterized protein FMAN_15531 [Fusarium mangiferae]CVL09377.1 uncharacterized protein FMAN_15531 [Fusarium mangiferae]
MSQELNDKQFYQASAPLLTIERKAFINATWKSSKAFNEFELSGYFRFLETERTSKTRVDDPAYSHLCFKHIFDIQSILYENLNEPPLRLQDLVQRSLVSWEPELEVVQDLIILVIKLTFMVRAEFPNSYSHPSPFQMQMQDNQSLKDTLRELQNVPPLQNLGTQNELPSWFNVIDLEKKANLRIDWTDHLDEHLTFQSGTLVIFRHIAVLMYMRESGIL